MDVGLEACVAFSHPNYRLHDVEERLARWLHSRPRHHSQSRGTLKSLLRVFWDDKNSSWLDGGRDLASCGSVQTSSHIPPSIFSGPCSSPQKVQKSDLRGRVNLAIAFRTAEPQIEAWGKE